jgi:[ribosomal protein S5]-alanine N-acetyltransferase
VYRELGACIVRDWQPTDAPAIVRYADNRRVWINLRDRFPHPYALADAEEFLAFACNRQTRTDFAIEVAGEAVGGVGLTLHDDVERVTAEIGYWLGEPYWGRGIMPAVVRAVTRHALTELGLVRVYAIPFAWNAASARVLEKAGYVLEGRMRRSAIKDGRIIDQLLYACTDADLAEISSNDDAR